MYQTILFPTDGSSGADAAMEHVLDLASTYGATVHVLNVVDSEAEESSMVMPDDGTGSSGMVKPDDVEEPSGMTATHDSTKRLERVGKEVVRTAAAEFEDQDIEAVTAIRRGSPYQVIVSYAEAEGIDLVVMPTHGRSGLDRYLLGSVTEKVIRTSDIPVLTVRLDGE
jgi:nucleotide-binding universal stress UspA family protein